jgi:hypothetical protein
MKSTRRRLTDGVAQGKLVANGSSFFVEAGKLDNWINHKRIDEYFKAPPKETP